MREVPPQSALALPRDIADFTAREDALALLHAQAQARDPLHPRVTLVCGHPGLGKTAFALHAAHTLAPLFPGGQLSLDLMGMAPTPLTSRDALAQLLRALGVPDSAVPADTQERAGLYRSLIRERRVVLVLDNAADEAQIRPLLPGSGPALTIITSRHSLPGLESVHRLPLRVLNPSRPPHCSPGSRRRPHHRRTAGHLELARLCGHLPLALRIAGSGWPPAAERAISQLVRPTSAEDYRLDTLQPVTCGYGRAFGLSYQKLPARAQLVLRRCSFTAGPDQRRDRRLQRTAAAGDRAPARGTGRRRAAATRGLVGAPPAARPAAAVRR
ncbi:AAA family ATPase [Streptacidiphilus sp. 4-A2]|nr:AAA family ATPase [Streptacidiphilus sp. 4-A2]